VTGICTVPGGVSRHASTRPRPHQPTTPTVPTVNAGDTTYRGFQRYPQRRPAPWLRSTGTPARQRGGNGGSSRARPSGLGSFRRVRAGSAGAPLAWANARRVPPPSWRSRPGAHRPASGRSWCTGRAARQRVEDHSAASSPVVTGARGVVPVLLRARGRLRPRRPAHDGLAGRRLVDRHPGRRWGPPRSARRRGMLVARTNWTCPSTAASATFVSMLITSPESRSDPLRPRRKTVLPTQRGLLTRSPGAAPHLGENPEPGDGGRRRCRTSPSSARPGRSVGRVELGHAGGAGWDASTRPPRGAGLRGRRSLERSRPRRRGEPPGNVGGVYAAPGA